MRLYVFLNNMLFENNFSIYINQIDFMWLRMRICSVAADAESAGGWKGRGERERGRSARTRSRDTFSLEEGHEG